MDPGDGVLGGVWGGQCVYLRVCMRARARACVRVCVCVFILNYDCIFAVICVIFIVILHEFIVLVEVLFIPWCLF